MRSSSKVRLKGLGVPQMGKQAGGDEYVEIVIDVPRKLTDRQKALLEELRKESLIRSLPVYFVPIDDYISTITRNTQGGPNATHSIWALDPSLIFLLTLALQAAAFELSADMITKEGEQKLTGKLYVKGNKYRIEMKSGSEYAIIRHDKNKSWIVIPDQKAYIEMPFDPKRKPAIEDRQSQKGTANTSGQRRSTATQPKNTR